MGWCNWPTKCKQEESREFGPKSTARSALLAGLHRVPSNYRCDGYLTSSEAEPAEYQANIQTFSKKKPQP